LPVVVAVKTLVVTVEFGPTVVHTQQEIVAKVLVCFELQCLVVAVWIGKAIGLSVRVGIGGGQNVVTAGPPTTWPRVFVFKP